jgi:hypothetical protein
VSEDVNRKLFTPTNRCFDDAIEFLQSVVQMQLLPKVQKQFRLAHGIVVQPVNHEEYVHAWVEQERAGGIVFNSYLDDGQLAYGEFSRKQFYDLFRVKERVLYTIPEAWAQNRKHGNYGPWKEKYKSMALPRGSLRKDGA